VARRTKKGSDGDIIGNLYKCVGVHANKATATAYTPACGYYGRSSTCRWVPGDLASFLFSLFFGKLKYK
jgi:hypothetical protein